MIYLFLDILLYNFTPFISYCFLINLNQKSYIYNLSIAIIIDFIILHTYFYNVIIVTLLYIIYHYLLKFNYHNFNIYYIVNLSFALLYYVIFSLIFSNINFINILNLLIINSIFIIASYKKNSSLIKFYR